ncbi:unnamed protein product, partial [Prunus brigantina]
VKSDVYSFGVLILEIAWKNWREGTASNLIDPTLTLRTGSRSEIMRCMHIGLLCVQENVADKPTMAFVIVILNSYSLSLPVPSKPFDMFLGSEGNSSATGLDQYKNNSNKAPENEASLIISSIVLD